MKGADIFSGCGGMSRGFCNAGIDVTVAMDFWDKALEVYKENFPSHDVHQVDLSDPSVAIELLKQHRPNVIFGGPPCRM